MTLYLEMTVLKHLSKLTIVIAISFMSMKTATAAGPPSPPGGGSDPPCWPAPCVPIDAGIGILIAAGLAYGGKMAYKTFKENP